MTVPNCMPKSTLAHPGNVCAGHNGTVLVASSAQNGTVVSKRSRRSRAAAGKSLRIAGTSSGLLISEPSDASMPGQLIDAATMRVVGSVPHEVLDTALLPGGYVDVVSASSALAMNGATGRLVAYDTTRGATIGELTGRNALAVQQVNGDALVITTTGEFIRASPRTLVVLSSGLSGVSGTVVAAGISSAGIAVVANATHCVIADGNGRQKVFALAPPSSATPRVSVGSNRAVVHRGSSLMSLNLDTWELQATNRAARFADTGMATISTSGSTFFCSDSDGALLTFDVDSLDLTGSLSAAAQDKELEQASARALTAVLTPRGTYGLRAFQLRVQASAATAVTVLSRDPRCTISLPYEFVCSFSLLIPPVANAAAPQQILVDLLLNYPVYFRGDVRLVAELTSATAAANVTVVYAIDSRSDDVRVDVNGSGFVERAPPADSAANAPPTVPVAKLSGRGIFANNDESTLGIHFVVWTFIGFVALLIVGKAAGAISLFRRPALETLEENPVSAYVVMHHLWLSAIAPCHADCHAIHAVNLYTSIVAAYLVASAVLDLTKISFTETESLTTMTIAAIVATMIPRAMFSYFFMSGRVHLGDDDASSNFTRKRRIRSSTMLSNNVSSSSMDSGAMRRLEALDDLNSVELKDGSGSDHDERDSCGSADARLEEDVVVLECPQQVSCSGKKSAPLPPLAEFGVLQKSTTSDCACLDEAEEEEDGPQDDNAPATARHATAHTLGEPATSSNISTTNNNTTNNSAENEPSNHNAAANPGPIIMVTQHRRVGYLASMIFTALASIAVVHLSSSWSDGDRSQFWKSMLYGLICSVLLGEFLFLGLVVAYRWLTAAVERTHFAWQDLVCRCHPYDGQPYADE